MASKVDLTIHLWSGDDPKVKGKLSVLDGRQLTAEEWEYAVQAIQALIWEHERYERRSDDAS